MTKITSTPPQSGNFEVARAFVEGITPKPVYETTGEMGLAKATHRGHEATTVTFPGGSVARDIRTRSPQVVISHLLDMARGEDQVYISAPRLFGRGIIRVFMSRGNNVEQPLSVHKTDGKGGYRVIRTNFFRVSLATRTLERAMDMANKPARKSR